MDFYTFLLLTTVILLFVALEFFRDWKYWNRIDRLLNRLQSQNYQEFRYYEDQYDKDLKNHDKQVKEILTNEQRDRSEESPEENILSPEDLEEDWNEEEVEGEKK